MSGGKTSTSSSTVAVPPEVLARYNSVNATAQSAASTPFQTYSTDPNAFVAPLTATQQAGINTTNQYATAAQPYMDAAAGLTMAGTQSADPSQIGAGQINQFMSPYLGDVMGSTEALQNQENQQQQAGQLGNAITSGAFGGDRAGIAAANLSQQQELANSSVLSNIANTGFNTALGAAQQQQGVNLQAQQADLARLQAGGAQLSNIGTAAQTAGLAGGQAQLTAGQAEQQTQQAGDTALYNQFLQQQSYPFQTAQFLANIAEGTGSLSGSTTTSTQPSPFFSDERLKEDVQPIGKTYDGQVIAKFRYKGDKQHRIGLIAQDVEKHHPEAVGLAGGYKTVDYNKATEKAAALGAGRAHFAGGGYSQDSGDEAAYTAGLIPGEGSYANPDGPGIVPPTPQNRHQLMIARNVGPPQQSGLAQVAQLAQSGKDIGNDITAGNKFVQGLGSGQWFNGMFGSQGGQGGYAQQAARGGHIRRRDDGGWIDDGSPEPQPINDEPEQDPAATGLGAMAKAQNSTPTSRNVASGTGVHGSLQSAAAPNGSASSGLGSTLSGAGALAAGLADLFALKRGGLVGREHHADGNSVGDDTAFGLDGTPLFHDPAPAGPVAPPRSPNVATADTAFGLDGTPLFHDPAPDVPAAPPRSPGVATADTADAASAKALAAAPAPAPEPKKAPGLAPAPAREEPAQQAPAGLAAGQAAMTPTTPENGGTGGAAPGFSDWLKQNQHLFVPLLAGLGTMASSNSRYLGSAILQGAGGAATAYEGVLNNEAQRNQELANTQLTGTQNAGATQTQQQHQYFIDSSGRPRVTLKNGQTPFEADYDAMRQAGNAPALVGEQEPSPADAPVSNAAVNGGAVPQPGAVPGAPAAPADTVLGQNGRAVVARDIDPRTSSMIGPDWQDRQKLSLENANKIQQAAMQAKSIQGLNLQLADQISQMGEGSGGPGGDDLNKWRGLATQITSTLQLPSVVDDTETDRGQIITKLNHQLASVADHGSVQGLQNALAAVPGLGQDASAAKDIIAHNLVNNYQTIEQGKYLDEASQMANAQSRARPNMYNTNNILNAYAADHTQAEREQRAQKIRALMDKQYPGAPNAFSAAYAGKMRREVLASPQAAAKGLGGPDIAHILGND